MNPAFDCSLDTSIDEMKRYIEEYNYPALLIDGRGKVLARNVLADYKVAPVRIGASIKSILSAQELEVFSTMSYGEIRNIQIKTAEAASAIAVRFYGFYFLGWLPSRAVLAKGVLDMNSAVGKGSLGVLSYCMEADMASASESRLLKQMAGEQLRREMNVGRMLEIVTNSNLKQFKCFNPYLAAKTVCGIADSLMADGDSVLISRLDATDIGCTGIEEDYCSALSAMIAFAAKNCMHGRLWVEGLVADRRYRVCVSFKSRMTVQDMETALYGEDENGVVNTAALNADLLYIRCIAENGLWGFGVDEAGNGEIVLSFSVPLYSTEAASLMQPTARETVSAAIKAQLVSLLYNAKE